MTLTPGSAALLARLDQGNRLYVFPLTRRAFVQRTGCEGVDVDYADAQRLLDHGDVMQVSPHSFVARAGILDEVQDQATSLRRLVGRSQ